MKKFEEFCEELKQYLQAELPEDYKDCKMVLQDVKKLNRSYTGLVNQKSGNATGPIINLTELYEDVKEKDVPIEDIAKNIVKTYKLSLDEDAIEGLEDWQQVKDRLYIRVNGYEKNKEMSENIPHKRVEDLMLTYHIKLYFNENECGSVLVTKELQEKYGVSDEELYEAALISSREITGVKIESMVHVIESMVKKDMQENGFTEEEIKEQLKLMIDDPAMEKNSMLVVTSKDKMMGSAVLFYPDTMKSIATIIDSSFYVLPSSIHEMLILPDDGEIEVMNVKQIVMQVNREEVNDNERLTDSVYFYNKEENKFEKVA